VTLAATTTHVVGAFLEFLKQLLFTLGGSAIAIAALAWLARSIITQWLSKDVESYKNQLQAQSNMALERLRSDLQILADRRNIEYSRIHEKRLEIISDLAGKIRVFHERVSAYVAPWEPAGGPTKEERRKLAGNALLEFNNYFLPRKFFLPKDTAEKIEAFRTALSKVTADFMIYVEQESARDRDPDKNLDVWIQADEYTSKQAPVLLADLEDDFRKILGIEQT
jgi:hypothetical protein